MILLKVNTTNPEDIRKSLISLCDMDEDMNGHNGPEYLWEIAKNTGFENNAEYLADRIMKNKFLDTARKKFEAYAREFFITNDTYYEGYEIEFLEEYDELIVAFHIWSRY